MINIGEYNNFVIARLVDFGAYLTDEDNNEILLPMRYLGDHREGDTISVFVYTDSEDRPIATTETPLATVNTFALMRVNSVNAVGAFLNWGLSGKELLVPFSEQKVKMLPGRSYVVYVYLDRNSGRVVASANLNRFLSKEPPRYSYRQEVDLLIVKRTEIGYKAIVDSSHWGMVYQNETYHDLNVGDHCKGFVKLVRPDGKIDVTTEMNQRSRIRDISRKILQHLEQNDGKMALNDNSSPSDIMSAFQCSKKDFKKAIGLLYKKRKIEISPEITLI